MNRRSRKIAAFLSALFILFTAVLLSAERSRAQQAQAPAATPAPSAAQSPAGQVQGYTLTPAQEAQAIAYAHARHELYFLDVAYGFLLLVIMLLLRVAPLYRDWATNWTDSDFGQVAVFTPLLLLTTDLLSLPTAIWEHRLALQYQQSIQAWDSWLADWVKSEGVEFSIAILMVWVLFTVIRKSPRKWWFWFWLAAVPLIVLGAIVEPVIVEPMFFKFAPLANTQPRLAANIEQMTIRAGAPIPQSRILEMTASAKLRALNAYVSGLGASKRVVVWDTTIRSMSEDEVLFVTGHEMGHYVLGHVRDGILFACAVLLFFLNLAYRLLHWMLARWGKTWAIRGPDDLAALPVLILLLTVFGFLFTPISNAYSRRLDESKEERCCSDDEQQKLNVLDRGEVLNRREGKNDAPAGAFHRANAWGLSGNLFEYVVGYPRFHFPHVVCKVPFGLQNIHVHDGASGSHVGNDHPGAVNHGDVARAANPLPWATRFPRNSIRRVRTMAPTTFPLR